METQPQNIIAIGRKRIPIEEIALVEPFVNGWQDPRLDGGRGRMRVL